MNKFARMLMVLILLFGLAACAGSDKETQIPADSNAASEESEITSGSTEIVPTEEPEPAAEEETQTNNVEEAQSTPEAEVNGDEIILFSDPAFETKVREVLGITEADITRAEAAAVTDLNLGMPGNDWSIPRISDLSDLQYFPNLVSLNLGWALSKNDGVDLSPLAGLSKLENLSLACTTIKSIEPLSGLTNMKNLEIWGTRTVIDISPLSGMTELETLWMSHNVISDLSPLAGLEKLWALQLEQNVITDITPISGLPNLKKLMISDNPIKDYTPLSDIYPNLEEKDFELLDHPLPVVFNDSVLEAKVRQILEKPEGDITLEMAEGLTELNLANEFSDFIPDEIKIRDVNSLRYFPNLVNVELQFNNLDNNSSDLEVLAAMPNLRILDLNGNNLFGYAGIAACEHLEWLSITGNRGEDLSPLTTLKELKTLYISYMPQITDISPLGELTELEALYMEGVSAEDLSPLANLVNLKTLYIPEPSGNYAPDFTVLEGIYPNLTDKNFEIN